MRKFPPLSSHPIPHDLTTWIFQGTLRPSSML